MPDQDGDGVLDPDDRCVAEPAGRQPDPGQPGCPLRDQDGDGVFDSVDQCVSVPAGPTADPQRPGCPDHDSDGDGIFDGTDQCPQVPAGLLPDADRRGCPLADRDGDRVPDRADACPDQPGAPSPDPKRNGCPGLLQVKAGQIVLLRPVFFATGKDVILKKSFPVLDAVAAALSLLPELKKLAVEGHTDNKGQADHNTELSDRRARSVQKYLIYNPPRETRGLSRPWRGRRESLAPAGPFAERNLHPAGGPPTDPSRVIRWARGAVTMGDIVRRPSGFYVRYKDADGRRRQRASHQPTKELARRYLLEIEGRVARGLVGIPEPKPAAPTVAELVERFLLEYSRPKIKDLGRYRTLARTALRRALPFIGGRAADSLQPVDVVRLRESLTRRGAANSVRLTLAFLTTTYSWATKAAILPSNPFRGVELPARQDLIEYLSRDEVIRLLALAAHKAAAGGVADRMRNACLVLALHAGMRKGELLGLRWLDLDLDARRLTVARSFLSTPKGGRPRHLRLPEATVPVLTAWRRECPRTAEDLVFPIVDRDLPRLGRSGDMLGLPALLAETGCRPLRRAWHAMRHSFASHFVMSGGNLLALQKILGHHDVKMTMIYAHLAPDFLGDEMNKLKF